MTSVVTLPRISTALIALLIAFLLAIPVFAQTTATTSSGTRSPVRKEVTKGKIETRQQILDTRKEKMATREAALKTRLSTFRDKNKATIAQRVNTNLNKINDKQTEMMLKHLAKMTEILTKLETRVNESKPDIKDPAAARAAIADSRLKIASAEALVNAQSGKDYTITTTSEANIKVDAEAARNALHTDLKSVRELVIAAKQSVAKAIRIAKSGKGEEATTSGHQ